VRFLLLPILAALASCGYQVGHLYDPLDVRVEIFDNITERRGHEFDLTEVVVREMSSRGFRINSPQARHTLKGRILEIRTPSALEDRVDAVLVGSLLFRVEVTLSGDDGHTVWSKVRSESVIFTIRREQTPETARREVFNRLARWIVARFEKGW
jgi:hypothetical protein